jgi:hypothetical protein
MMGNHTENTKEVIFMENIDFKQIKEESCVYSNIERLKEIRSILISKNEDDVRDLGRKPLNQIAEILMRSSHESDIDCIYGDDFSIFHNGEYTNEYEDNIKNIYLDGDQHKVTLQYLNQLIEFLKAENSIPTAVLNYTPHDINIGNVIISSSGNARVSEEINVVDSLNDVDIISKKLGVVTGLPDEKHKQFIIVSLMVAQALPEREDLLIPGELVRDNTGKIIGCKNLCRL